jgi:hypothetical protein
VGACDALVLPGQKFATFLYPGNTALSQPGRLIGGAKPLERQVISIISKEHFYQIFYQMVNPATGQGKRDCCLIVTPHGR